MKLLITSVTVADPNSEHNGKVVNLLIDEGIIRLHTGASPENAEVLDAKGMMVSPGWFDMRVNYYDPGFEFREGVENGMQVSAAGGFTGVALLPETQPAISGKSQVEYIKNQGRNSIVDVHPLASILQDNGETISEMHDLLNSGAVAFSSGYKSIADEGLLLRAMQYSSTMNIPLIISPVNKSLYGKGQMNEGKVNVQLGLKGIPSIAEEAELNKIITLCRYAGARIHISGVSCATSLEQIKSAQKEGLKITADTTGHHLSFDENDLMNFDTNMKVRPPFRRTEDKNALKKAVLDGLLSCVVSDHNPLEEDKKKCEFEIAGFGASGAQTLYPQMLAALGENAKIVELLAIRPREILGLEIPVIKEGAEANLTIFDPNAKWILNDQSNKSKSKNHPLWNTELKGKAIAIINNGQYRKV